MIKRYAAITTVLAGMFALFAPSADAAPKAPCDRVAPADRALCRQVAAQPAYGWTNVKGVPQNWVPAGRVLVANELGGLTKREVHSYLIGMREEYRDHVSAVKFDVRRIVKVCGNTDGAGVVSLVDGDGKPGGPKYTHARIVCA